MTFLKRFRPWKTRVIFNTLPGHGQKVHLPPDEMQRHMRRLVKAMRGET